MESKFNYCPDCGKSMRKEEKLYKVVIMRRIPFTEISFNFSKKNRHHVCSECTNSYLEFVSKKYDILISISQFNW
jgi:hypothetical protein